jgi:hypothetical protein
MYTFRNTEKLRGKGSDYETYSLLYLIGLHNNSDDIEYVLIDCFNDTTGSNLAVNKLWDIQAKGYNSIFPKKIGESLYTLFENYLSGFYFIEYILLLQTMNNEYLIDKTLNLFCIDNVENKTKKRIKTGLIEEYKRRNGLSRITDKIDTEIDEFLSIVLFKIWDTSKAASIKSLIQFKDKSIKDDLFYESIFNEIRDKQSTVKNYV